MEDPGLVVAVVPDRIPEVVLARGVATDIADLVHEHEVVRVLAPGRTNALVNGDTREVRREAVARAAKLQSNAKIRRKSQTLQPTGPTLAMTRSRD